MATAVQATLFTDAEFEVRRRVDAVLLENMLTTCEEQILRIIGYAYGTKNALSIDNIQRILENRADYGYSDRQIKGAVKCLIEQFGIPIGSSRQQPYGYYLVVSDQDAEDAVRPLRNEIFSLLRRIQALSPKSKFVRELQGQLDLLRESDSGV